MGVINERSWNGRRGEISTRWCDVCFRGQIPPRWERADAASRKTCVNLGYEQLEREQNSIFDEIKQEALEELAPRRRVIRERQRESHRARGGEVADVAVSDAFFPCGREIF